MPLLIKQTLSEQLCEILKSDILSGRIKPGDRLVNRELQRRFEVSSTPVRDAINKLAQEGLLEEVTRTGSRVICVDAEHTAKVNEFIACISREALTLSAAKGHMDETVRDCRRILERQQKTENLNEYFHADSEFHRVFFNYCENPILTEIYQRYDMIRLLLIRAAIQTPKEQEKALLQHEEILNAYRDGNIALASDLLIRHYSSGMELIQKGTQELPDTVFCTDVAQKLPDTASGAGSSAAEK